MDAIDPEETRAYSVVVNHEDQYSIWPVRKELPPGWSRVGKQGRRDECLAYIDEVWTDMRPRSLRDQMGAQRLESQGPESEVR